MSPERFCKEIKVTVNMGKFDRVVRLVVAVVLVYAAFATETFGSGILFWVALAVTAVLTLTALVGNCPLYSIIGIRTCRLAR